MTVKVHPAHRNPHAVLHPVEHPETLSYLRGIDVSHWDGRVDWGQVKAAGVAFAFAKATDGRHYTDPTFSTNWAAMKAAGLVRGAYHFAHPKHDAADQAKRFYDVVQPGSGDLPLVLDLEVNDGKRPAVVWAWAQTFLAEVQRLTGKPAFFYSYAPFWVHDMGNPKDSLTCPLWVAAYTRKPHVPDAWTDWTIWQYTDKGKVKGIHAHVDQNYFKGTLAELKQLAYP